MNCLFGITIGPVQTYIEESRKLSDLKNSSKIISDIMKEILKEIKDEDKSMKIIYPNCHDFDKFDFSNYTILETEIDIDMDEVKCKVYSKFNGKLNRKGISQEYDLREIFHLFWAKEKFESESDYYKTYKKLTRLLRSLKNTYEFNQEEQESGKKCLMCGKHNVVKIEKKKEFNLNYNEELCPLCLIKRIYKRDIKIESVYSIALKYWIEKNNKNLKEINEKLQDIFYDDKKYKYFSREEIKKSIALLSEERDCKASKAYKELKDDLITENDINLEKIKLIEKCMNDLYKDGFVSLPTYEYSFIQFDADNLGEWMGGKYITDEYKYNFKEYQKFVSGCLVNFGEELKERLKETKCTVIYSGGDDFLGVIPNEDIVTVSEIIEELFKIEVKNKIEEKYKKINEKITYSMSVTIAQCKDPMSYALKRTREGLEKAKTRFESKNAVALTYIINNGKEFTCYLKKEEIKRLFNIVNKVQDIENYILFSYINKFEREFSIFKFEDITFDEMQKFYKILNCEFKRLFGKSISSMKEASDSEKEKVDLYKSETIELISKVINHNCIEVKPNHEHIDFINIINVIKMSEKLYEIKFRA